MSSRVLSIPELSRDSDFQQTAQVQPGPSTVVRMVRPVHGRVNSPTQKKWHTFKLQNWNGQNGFLSVVGFNFIRVFVTTRERSSMNFSVKYAHRLKHIENTFRGWNRGGIDFRGAYQWSSPPPTVQHLWRFHQHWLLVLQNQSIQSVSTTTSSIYFL